MKKVLFGIMALSMAAFAANPGTADTASVPVKVIAEIITAPTGLTITDEAGTVIDELLLDHGRIVKNTATSDSVAYKLFKVQRFDGAQTPVTRPIGAGKLNVKLDDPETTLKKNGTSTISTLASTLALTGGATQKSSIEYDHPTLAADTEHVGRVTSTIAQANLNAVAETGIHHNSRERTLTVTYIP
ncbi:hypothetical protein [Cetobacterium somerae]|uniref:hypothetical protein n=1 Tax=Cetobacterium somerae TaxID=188913 RepID=UPI00248E53E0|nr:hypothetical protein [Cetobacterium somerae]